MRKLSLLGLIALAATALAVGPASADDDDEHDDGGAKTWRVTITNLTPPGPGAPGSQPLSPPLFVVHSRQADVWSVGQIASHGVARRGREQCAARVGVARRPGREDGVRRCGRADPVRRDALVHS